MGKEIYKRNILYAFAKAIMENDRNVLLKERDNIHNHRYYFDVELMAKKNGINIRTGKPYKPSTIKECERMLKRCERLEEACDSVLELFNASLDMVKIKKRSKSKGKIVQLTAYQGKGW